MKIGRLRKKVFLIAILTILLGVGFVLKKNIGAIKIPPTDDTVHSGGDFDAITKKLSVPDGFDLIVYATDLPGARVIEFDDKGRLVVSQTAEGKISVVSDTNGDGVADSSKTIAEHLNKPHGLAFRCADTICFFYVAEHDKLTRYVYDSNTASVSGYTKLLDLPASATDRHFTRTLLFLPSPDDNILLISIGSSCDVCHEGDNQRAGVIAYDISTGKSEDYARGLRNSVFMTLNPVDGRVFATEMGRDGLGDNIPPDEVNVIEKGKNYGWPICFGDNIHDDMFDTNTYIRNPCMSPFETPSFLDLPAHSAPLGLSFIPEEGWPEDHWYNLLVAFHGSWNRSEPTGYKIVRLTLDTKGNYSGSQDFISGWLTPDGKKLGRPVDIKVLSGGVIYISDDLNGVIYTVSRGR
ncbi:MAG: hypothetical protein A3C06_00970 [Candidatus Taylorbacteria bacterium RIFCSPHIGHO2_02_FULL_46_13]|uniref:Pyrroloquinoline quinone-dependent pyranose dehydrogenase beta-propeller domain-containing protein n=1 Tax=Candidatus Taylorbacteria bacterium RIFCSPHIGHO2_02_FULL_46_13 TaxID=1802312 RepID=A0A1G2MT65_9BACT|nr:MAG: hypothetical protein A3C06_00970 [Candidatus Taylorbacteria bacterium RIFCSPHIGHO2_02_FULL_46_13]